MKKYVRDDVCTICVVWDDKNVTVDCEYMYVFT